MSCMGRWTAGPSEEFGGSGVVFQDFDLRSSRSINGRNSPGLARADAELAPRGYIREMRIAIALVLVLLEAGCGGRVAESIPAPPDVAAPPANSVKHTSGISSRVLRAGTGQRHPRATDLVVVHYTGWATDGKSFDSSVTRGEPAQFRLDEVIKGWTDGVQMMVHGEKRRFWIP